LHVAELFTVIRINAFGAKHKFAVDGDWHFRCMVEAVTHRYAVLSCCNADECDRTVVLKLPPADGGTLTDAIKHATLAHEERNYELLRAMRWAVRAAQADLRPLGGKAVRREAKGTMSDPLLPSELVPVAVTDGTGRGVWPAVEWASCGFVESIDHRYEVLEDPEDPAHAVVLKHPYNGYGPRAENIEFEHTTLAREDMNGGWAQAMRWAMQAARDEIQADAESEKDERTEKKAKPRKNDTPEPGDTRPPRQKVVVERVVRNSAVVAKVKRCHDHRCQVCDIRLETPAGPYAEGAHVRPLSSPHNGPDVVGNVLCLCPNHHVLFDAGAFTVRDDLRLIGMSGTLRTVPTHRLDKKQLRYHREHREKLFVPSP
jgi:hypothetical protein